MFYLASIGEASRTPISLTYAMEESFEAKVEVGKMRESVCLVLEPYLPFVTKPIDFLLCSLDYRDNCSLRGLGLIVIRLTGQIRGVTASLSCCESFWTALRQYFGGSVSVGAVYRAIVTLGDRAIGRDRILPFESCLSPTWPPRPTTNGSTRSVMQGRTTRYAFYITRIGDKVAGPRSKARRRTATCPAASLAFFMI